MQSEDGGRVYATRGLLEVLCELAADADPQEVSVAVAATAAGDLGLDSDDAGPGFDGDLDLSPTTPVFTDFYLPDAGGSVSAVFGMDLGVPAGQTHGRFVSHPLGDRQVALTDDLAATMFVAVPPWEPGDVAAFDRSSRRLDLVPVDAEPPERSVA